MLRAHANTTSEDFIAQLRTYVIAMGLSTQVVDCVDDLMGIVEDEDDAAILMKNEILEAVRNYFDENPSPLAEILKKTLVAIIEDV